MSLYRDELTIGQIELLETIKPLNEWNYELVEYFEYDNFFYIDETFWQNSRTITFDDFYYAGVNMTIINNDENKLAILKELENDIKERIVNSLYHDMARRFIINYQIGKITYEDAYNDLFYFKYLNNLKQINKIQNWYRNKHFIKKTMPILWKIAEYYMANKYKPENINKICKHWK